MRHEADRVSGDIARLATSSHGTATVVARFGDVGPGALGPLIAVLAPRALEVRKLDTVVAESPATLGDAVRRVLHTAAIVAACFGAIGAMAGALLVDGEAMLPSFGWFPGPLVGAAIGGGVCGAIGVLVGAAAMILAPSLALRREPPQGVLLVVRARSFDLDAVVTRIVEAGGKIAAFG